MDMNAERFSSEPVENIYWPEGTAPEGMYKVIVNYYRQRDNNETNDFKVAIKAGTDVQEFQGSLKHEGQKTLVHSFVMGPKKSPAPAGTFSRLIGLWTALLAIGISLALVIGQNLFLRRALFSGKQLLIILIGGLLVGIFSGGATQNAFATLFSSGSYTTIGQALGWTMIGALLAAGLSLFIPNLPRKPALLSGSVGGLAGGLAFIFLAPFSDIIARMLGALILGISIGLAVALVEQLAREAHLLVQWGPGETTIINLGSTPVILGSSPEAHLYLPREKGFPPIAACVTLVDGRIEFHDKSTASRVSLRNGSKIQIGPINIEVIAASESVVS